MYFTGIPRRNGSLTVHEQARAGQSVQRVLVGQKPDAEANELEHRTSEPPVLFILSRAARATCRPIRAGVHLTL